MGVVEPDEVVVTAEAVEDGGGRCKVFAWGASDFGQLGLGHCEPKTEPSGLHSLWGKRVTDGLVYSWGWGGYGQLGHGDSNDCLLPRVVEWESEDGSSGHEIVAVSCGERHSIILDDKGRAYSFGWGVFGQLGLGTKDDSLTPQLIDALKGVFITQVHCGQRHTLAMDNKGRVYAFGYGGSGQLGQGRMGSLAQPQQVGVPRSRSIVAGRNTSFAITEEGKVFAWGRGMQYQLGNSTLEDCALPFELELPFKCSSLYCGNCIVYAVDQHGKVWSWGRRVEGAKPSLPTLGDRQEQSKEPSAATEEETIVRELNIDIDVDVGNVVGVDFVRPSPRVAPEMDAITCKGCVEQIAFAGGYEGDMETPIVLDNRGCVYISRYGGVMETLLSSAEGFGDISIVSGGSQHAVVCSTDTRKHQTTQTSEDAVQSFVNIGIQVDSSELYGKDVVGFGDVFRSSSDVETLSNELHSVDVIRKKFALSGGVAQLAMSMSHDLKEILQTKDVLSERSQHLDMDTQSSLNNRLFRLQQSLKQEAQAGDSEGVRSIVKQRNLTRKTLFLETQRLVDSLAALESIHESRERKISDLLEAADLAQKQIVRDEISSGETVGKPEQTEAERMPLSDALSSFREWAGKVVDRLGGHMSMSNYHFDQLSRCLEKEKELMEANAALLEEGPRLCEQVKLAGTTELQQLKCQPKGSERGHLNAMLLELRRQLVGLSSAEEEDAKIKKMKSAMKRLKSEKLKAQKAMIEANAKMEWLRITEPQSAEFYKSVLTHDGCKEKVNDVEKTLLRMQKEMYLYANSSHPELHIEGVGKQLPIGKLSENHNIPEANIVNRVLSDYQVVRVISDSRRKVFLCRLDGRSCVLKEFHLFDKKTRESFELEASLLSRLRHPTIAEVEAVFFDGMRAYIQMPYYSGGTLRDWIHHQPSINHIQSVFRQVIQGVAFMHDRGVIHRDLKLENVLLSQNHRVIICDFGISKDTVDHPTETITDRHVRGTEGYIAPEVLQGGKATAMSDIWALGVMIYHTRFHQQPVLLPGNNSVRVPSTAELYWTTNGANPAAPPHVDPTNTSEDAHGSTKRLRRSRGRRGSRSQTNAFTEAERAGGGKGSMRTVIPETAQSGERLVDLLKLLLHKDPSCRPTASECLVHPFFTACHAEDLSQSRQLVASDRKLEALYAYLRSLRSNAASSSPFVVHVRRDHITSDAIAAFSRATSADIVKQLKVVFEGEIGVDSGGMAGELFSQFFDACMSHSSPYFEYMEESESVGREIVFIPRRDCAQYDHFRAIGRLAVSAIVHSRPVNLPLAPSVLKYLLGLSVDITDMEAYDPLLSMGLRRLLATPGAELLMLDFVGIPPRPIADQDSATSAEGPVNDSNKQEYVDRRVYDVLIGCRKKQLEAFKEGFETVNLQSHLSMLTCTELMLLICGQQNLSPHNVIESLVFSEFSPDSPTPSHLTTALQSLAIHDLRRFLRLTTAYCSIPAGGLRRKIIVQRVGDVQRLPVGHTCSHQLDLPDYRNYDQLKTKLLTSLANLESGFQLV